MIVRATGQIPLSLEETYPREKLRGPIHCRVVVESLTTTLYPTILPKLQWWAWNGCDEPGGLRGHWGWIPRHCLINGSWKDSWSDRLRMLRCLYRDPNDPTRVVGESTVQFMSHDQHPTDFASGEFHFILHDEPPSFEIWKEDRARAMSLRGTNLLAMTWPDNPAIPIDWVFDEVYDRSKHDPEVEWINIFTTDNPHLDQESIASDAARMSDQERQVRIYGQPIRFSNRIHPLFTDQERWWCFGCGDDRMVVNGHCTRCDSEHVCTYNHVQQTTPHPEWPCVYLLDPHPRKPHMMTWIQLSPDDDCEQICELAVDGGSEEVRDAVYEIEQRYGWTAITRLIDPNMGRSPASARTRELTWQDEFGMVGLRCDLADDSDVGRQRFNDLLKPDKRTGRPRFVSNPGCTTTHTQLQRYTWDDRRRFDNRDIKQTPKALHDDYPTLFKYFCNFDPTYRGLRHLGQIFHNPGRRTAIGY